MAWDKDLADIVGRLRDIEREIETAIAEMEDELKDARDTSYEEGYTYGKTEKGEE